MTRASTSITDSLNSRPTQANTDRHRPTQESLPIHVYNSEGRSESHHRRMSTTMDAHRRSRERPRPPPVAPKRRDKLLQDNRAADDLRELRTAFAMFDQNHDGKICREDLRSSLRMMGHNAPEELIEKIIKNGASRDGVIGEDTFVSWMLQMTEEDSTVLRYAFQILDRDGDGLMDKDDLRVGFSLLGEHVSDTMLDIMFDEADRDKDARLNYDEFIDILKK